MSNKETLLWASAKRVQISPAEKAEVKASIVALSGRTLQAFTPEASKLNQEEKQIGKQELRSFIGSYSPKRNMFTHGFFTRGLSLALALLIIVSAGGTAVYASDDAVPGDTLYSVKLHVNEPIRGYFKRSKQDRAEWAAYTFERRMGEMAAISKRPGVAPATISEALERMDEHAERMQEHLDSIESDEQSERIRASLEKKLQHHQELYEGVESGTVSLEQLHAIKSSMKRHHTRFKQPDHRKPDANRKERLQQLPTEEQKELWLQRQLQDPTEGIQLPHHQLRKTDSLNVQRKVPKEESSMIKELRDDARLQRRDEPPVRDVPTMQVDTVQSIGKVGTRLQKPTVKPQRSLERKNNESTFKRRAELKHVPQNRDATIQKQRK